MNRLNRRHVLQTLLAASAIPAASTLRAQSARDVAALLRAGACVLMLRHAQTVAGVGDPPGFQLDQCSTQRNLSDKGRDQAKRIGQWFTAVSWLLAAFSQAPGAAAKTPPPWRLATLICCPP